MRFVIVFISIFGPAMLWAQDTEKNPRYQNPLWEINLNYKAISPIGDLALRYGYVNGAGADVLYKTSKNYFFGLSSHLFFGSAVRGTSYVDIFKDPNGYVFTDDGTPVYLAASMRGVESFVVGGKMFPCFKNTPQLALYGQLGVGFLQHRYLFSVPGVLQFTGGYLRGYDRMSNGPAISQTFGMSHLGLDRLINFNLGIEVTEAFTTNRRYYDYATGGLDTKKYLDMMVSLKFSWVLPVKAKNKKEPVYFR